jgi:hypothetical protein
MMNSDDPAYAQSMLGPPVREHRTRWSYLAAVGIISVLFGVGGVLGLIRASIRLIQNPSSENDIVALAATVPILLVSAGVGLWGYRRIHRVVVLHHGGIHYRDAGGERVVPWQSIDGIYHKIVRVYRADVEIDVRDEYTLGLRDGTRLSLDYHFADVDALGGALTGTLTEMMLPSYRQAFQAGYPVDFGPLRLDGYGVHTASGSLPWYEVESLSWKAGILASDRAFLMVRRRGGLLAWAKVPIEDIKNYGVLIEDIKNYGVLMRLAADMGKAA